MFCDMAQLVEEQGEMIDRIEFNVKNAAAHVELGRSILDPIERGRSRLGPIERGHSRLDKQLYSARKTLG